MAPQDPTQLKGGLATTAISLGPQEVLVRHQRDEPLGVHAHGPSSAPAEMQPAKGVRPLTALQIVLPPGGVMLKLTRLCVRPSPPPPSPHAGTMLLYLGEAETEEGNNDAN